MYDFEYSLVGSELEALLEENRLIEIHDPPVNVQRRIAEGASRYSPPVLPIALLSPSARAGRIELFVFGPDLQPVQRGIDPKRPPARALAMILRYALGERPPPPASARSAAWGATGREICLRYFCRYRSRLQWIEINRAQSLNVLLGQVLRCAKTVALKDPEPGEFFAHDTG